jgi:hypothetical protein
MFADGTTIGDSGWSQVIVLRRQQDLQMLSAAVADLSAIKSMANADAIKILEASKGNQLDAIEKNRRSFADKAEQLGEQTANPRVFSEDVAEVKQNNVQLRAAGDSANHLSVIYSSLESMVKTLTDTNRAARIKAAKATLETELHSLGESRPALSIGVPRDAPSNSLNTVGTR